MLNRGETPDYQYYNITVPFVRGDYTANQAYCKYDVELSDPILPRANDYYMSIVRFSIPLSSIPILVPQVKTYQLPPNQTLYNNDSTLLDYMVAFNDVGAGTYYRDDLVYIPENNAPVPIPPSQNDGLQKITSYYFVYSYQWFIDIINRSLANAWADLFAAKPAVGAQPPYFLYNTQSQIISLITPYTMITQNIRLLVNFPLINLLQAFKTEVVPVPNTAQFADQTQDFFELCITSTNNTNIQWQDFAYAKPGATIATPPLYLQFAQEYEATQFWSPFYDIAFFSGSMPTNNEVLQIDLQNNSINNPSYLPVLTDFNPLLETGLRTVAQYYPQGQYRLLDLTSPQPLRKISLQVYWLNKFNQLFPVLMSPGQYFTVKIMFVKKSAYKP